MTRGEFLKTAGSAAVLAALGDTFGAEAKVPAAPDYARLQREVDEIDPEAFKAYLRGGCDRLGTVPRGALGRLDDAFDKVLAEVKSAVVTDRPAVWLVYNMGVVVKTAAACFSIDLMHRKAPEMAPLLDFALITHNHSDHYTEAFYKAMNGAGKTVISNFKDNYGVNDWNANGGYTRAEKAFEIKDVRILTSPVDHNGYLVDFVTAFEIRIGEYTIFHSGDCSDVAKLNPKRRPDLWIEHPYCGMKTADGVRKLKPLLTAVGHLNELTHARDRWRWTWADGLRAKEEAERLGCRAVVPLWGERIV